ncbi:hypothetical protein F5Y03DRAFT_391118 [Xylaria venustula]|nr:hypothetical protein F5Y03DRAFT_391118 [Xylaria venustula]
MPRSVQHKRKFHAISEDSTQQETHAAESSRTGAQTPANRPPLEVLYPCQNLSSDHEINVDIVAVHGLGSNVDWSWAWQDKSGYRPPVHWLKDLNMLPSVVPHARIITYNYESRWHAKAPETRLELYGEELATSLHNFRSDIPKRPLIFIAHSFGGLVVLYGLLHADRTETLKDLAMSTVGFAPLGTPFRGTKMQDLARKVAWLLTPLGSHAGTIAELEPDGKHLSDQVHAFGQLRNRLDIPTTCFFELYDSDYGKKIGLSGLIRGKVVEEESAHIPGWGRVPLYVDHFQLNKFSGPTDRGFLQVSKELHTMYANRNSVIERRKQIIRTSHFMVPFGRNNNFIGRDTILRQLRERVPPSANKNDCQHTAIEGLGGKGKTQIALEIAYQTRDRYPDCSIFWVPAVDSASFENAFREIGRLLQLPNINDEKADVKMLVKSALNQLDTGSWFLIIDNVDDTDMLFNSMKLVEYLPFSRLGSILFTTRYHEVAVKLDISQGSIINVPEMDDAEATKMLEMGLKESQRSNVESTKRLLHFLANLPLAIKQASAFMTSNRNVTVSQYLGLCESSDTNFIGLLSKKFEDRYRYKDYAMYRNPVATTWLISFEHLSQHNPQAADYLKFICFLAEKDVPLSLLPPTSEIDMAEAIGSLSSYAFILERDTPGSFDMHRLVRLATRNWLHEKGEWEQWTATVVRRLAEQYPYPKHDNKETWTRYLPHGQVLLGIEDGGLDGIMEEYLDLRECVAESYDFLGKYSEAERLRRRTLSLHETALGRGHPGIPDIKNNLAGSLVAQYKYQEAEELYQQAVEQSEKMLGKEHLDTLLYSDNFALVLKMQRKYEEARKIQKQTLEIKQRILGEKHASTLWSTKNFADILGEMGELREAETIQRQNFELYQDVLGKEHPDTLNSMHNLGWVLGQQEKYQKAEKIHQQVFELRQKVLGREHPDTLDSMHTLGWVFGEQKKYQEAEKIMQETVELSEKVLGRQHPNTDRSIGLLVWILQCQGKEKEAEEMLARRVT